MSCSYTMKFSVCPSVCQSVCLSGYHARIDLKPVNYDVCAYSLWWYMVKIYGHLIKYDYIAILKLHVRINAIDTLMYM